MKRLSVLILFSVFLTGAVFAQKNTNYEVLYFKDNLACCQAKACDALQKDVEGTLTTIMGEDKIKFTVVKLADDANNEMVEKYNAKSQTVVCVKTKRKKEKVADLSKIVAKYRLDKDKEMLKTALKAEIVKMN